MAAEYNLAELKGAVNILESLIEVANEEGDESIPVSDIRILLNKYKRKLEVRQRFS